MPDHLTPCASRGLNPRLCRDLSCCSQILNPPCHPRELHLYLSFYLFISLSLCSLGIFFCLSLSPSPPISLTGCASYPLGLFLLVCLFFSLSGPSSLVSMSDSSHTPDIPLPHPALDEGPRSAPLALPSPVNLKASLSLSVGPGYMTHCVDWLRVGPRGGVGGGCAGKERGLSVCLTQTSCRPQGPAVSPWGACLASASQTPSLSSLSCHDSSHL